MQGIPFRDAYKMIGEQVERNAFTPSPLERAGVRSHEGSIGNLCNDKIQANMRNIF
jgi:argininosuccinate lyase